MERGESYKCVPASIWDRLDAAGVDHEARAVYFYLYAGRDVFPWGIQAWPSSRPCAQGTGLSVDQVENGLRKLQAASLIMIEVWKGSADTVSGNGFSSVVPVIYIPGRLQDNNSFLPLLNPLHRVCLEKHLSHIPDCALLRKYRQDNHLDSNDTVSGNGINKPSEHTVKPNRTRKRYRQSQYNKGIYKEKEKEKESEILPRFEDQIPLPSPGQNAPFVSPSVSLPSCVQGSASHLASDPPSSSDPESQGAPLNTTAGAPDGALDGNLSAAARQGLQALNVIVAHLVNAASSVTFCPQGAATLEKHIRAAVASGIAAKKLEEMLSSPEWRGRDIWEIVQAARSLRHNESLARALPVAVDPAAAQAERDARKAEEKAVDNFLAGLDPAIKTAWERQAYVDGEIGGIKPGKTMELWVYSTVRQRARAELIRGGRLLTESKA